MATVNFNVPFPPPGNWQNSLVQFKTQVSLAAAGLVNLQPLSTQGRFFATKIIVHDPSGACTTTTLSFGSLALANATALSAAVTLSAFAAAGSTYLAIDPGQVTATAGTVPTGLSTILPPGDTITCTVATPAAGVTVQIDVIGYYE